MKKMKEFELKCFENNTNYASYNDSFKDFCNTANEDKNSWNFDEVYSGAESIDGLLQALKVICNIHDTKYPNDKILEDTIEILRAEICGLFGGFINYKD